LPPPKYEDAILYPLTSSTSDVSATGSPSPKHVKNDSLPSYDTACSGADLYHLVTPSGVSKDSPAQSPSHSDTERASDSHSASAELVSPGSRALQLEPTSTVSSAAPTGEVGAGAEQNQARGDDDLDRDATRHAFHLNDVTIDIDGVNESCLNTQAVAGVHVGESNPPRAQADRHQAEFVHQFGHRPPPQDAAGIGVSVRGEGADQRFGAVSVQSGGRGRPDNNVDSGRTTCSPSQRRVSGDTNEIARRAMLGPHAAHMDPSRPAELGPFTAGPREQRSSSDAGLHAMSKSRAAANAASAKRPSAAGSLANRRRAHSHSSVSRLGVRGNRDRDGTTSPSRSRRGSLEEEGVTYVWKDGRVQVHHPGSRTSTPELSVSSGQHVQYVWRNGNVERVITGSNN
ncbi:hypothetical protein BaRGS_00035114, partial [Batillaria attramentaria]